MQTVSEIEAEAMKLPEAERAGLACRLLSSLPAVLADNDDGVAEALRRDAENPVSVLDENDQGPLTS
jgi:hypothetical protein